MLRQRVITSLVLMPVVVLAVFLVDTLSMALIVTLILCLGAWEWTKFAGISKISHSTIYLAVIAGLLITCYLFRSSAWFIYTIYLGALWWLFVAIFIVLFAEKSLSLSRSRPLKLLGGIVVLVPAGLSVMALHGEDPVLLIFLFFLIWGADIFAYFTGKKWGKTRLSPQISPGKTWEGAGGGLLAGLVLALVYGIKQQLQLYDIIIFLLICSLTVMVSIMGDLFESLMKRSVKLKDSGDLLPGHGGVLDRIDSLTAATPCFFTVLSLAGVVT